MNFSEDQVLALAPDDASRKAGSALASPGKWVSKGKNDLALWGECQGSGSKPYQTQIDLQSIAFKCSCPSRKFPCKHGIGLLLLNSRQPALFTDSATPEWVSDWIGKRQEKAVQKEAAPAKPVDEAAQAKRQQAREESIEQGIDELLTWMKDLVRNGLLSLPEKGPAFMEEISRRMIDAKAPGLANQLRQLSQINLYQEGWQSRFLEQLARIYLIAKGFQHREAINPLLKEDLSTAVGITISQEELKQQSGITDQWLVIGKQLQEEDQLTTDRTWLYGLQSGKYALVLQFIVRGQGLQFSLSTGMLLQAELVYFPSSAPLRALIKSQQPIREKPLIKGFSGWQEQLQHRAARFANLPFQLETPALVHQVRPVQYQGAWWLQDQENHLMPLTANYPSLWKLLALSGGAPLDLAIVQKDDRVEPLSAFYQQELISL